ncbi:hypothetical protein [Dyadobacter sp. CY351]|uniref:hypothetical protein n=1 Tax=Dyadobacter sp. CY351 TaxID=2909337 RepID=UPI001F3457A6|nr:hypothetical protein [Dyadobacter sp. CY351]MCF2517134.1 hypothetical protein [Dyadobacter sp. CY351]
MKKALLLFITGALFSCSPIYMVSKSEFQQIPKGTKKIVIQTEMADDSLFTIISKSFSREGWVVKSDKGSMQISAEPKSVGSGTALKPFVFIEDKKAYYSGEWGLDQKGQLMMQSMVRANTVAFEPIAFERSGITKNDVAFQGLLLLAKKIPGELTYSK